MYSYLNMEYCTSGNKATVLHHRWPIGEDEATVNMYFAYSVNAKFGGRPNGSHYYMLDYTQQDRA